MLHDRRSSIRPHTIASKPLVPQINVSAWRKTSDVDVSGDISDCAEHRFCQCLRALSTQCTMQEMKCMSKRDAPSGEHGLFPSRLIFLSGGGRIRLLSCIHMQAPYRRVRLQRVGNASNRIIDAVFAVVVACETLAPADYRTPDFQD